MHDDEDLEEKFEEPEKPWTEEQWEKFMLENEKLMDKYQKVWDEDPERKWKDPADLYMKAHYGLDLGEDMPEPETGEEEETEEEPLFENESEKANLISKEEDEEEAEAHSDDSVQGFRKVSAYKTAFQIALKVLEALKKIKPKEAAEEALRREFSFHALRIAADIAGAHGMGYEDEVLCGTIVKLRWALAHAENASKLLESLQTKYPGQSEWPEIKEKLQQVQVQLQLRIAELRAKVWWDK